MVEGEAEEGWWGLGLGLLLEVGEKFREWDGIDGSDLFSLRRSILAIF